jgi:stage III sporulation protein AA
MVVPQFVDMALINTTNHLSLVELRNRVASSSSSSSISNSPAIPSAIPSPVPAAAPAPAQAATATSAPPPIATSAPKKTQPTTKVAAPTKQSAAANRASIAGRFGMKPIETVTTRTHAEEVVSLLIAAKVESVAIDCEGIELGADGKLCLIQLTAKENPIFLFSLLEDSGLIEALKPLLEHPNIEKVLHDCRQDCAALEALGIRMRPLNDTQKMYDLLQELTSRVDNSGGETWTSVVTNKKRIGLNQLLAAFNFKMNPHKDKMKNHHDKWDQPIANLTKEMIEYAAWDVFELLELRDKIKEEIDKQTALAVAASSDEYATSTSGSPAASIPGSASAFDSLRPPPVGKDGTSSGPVFEVRFDGERQGEPIRFASQEISDDQGGSESSRGDDADPISSEVRSVIGILPQEYEDHIVAKLIEFPTDPMVEFVVDFGCLPTMRLKSGMTIRFDKVAPPMDLTPFLQRLLDFKLSESRRQLDIDPTSDVETQLNKFFSSDNRIGIRGSLHRISCKRSRTNGIDGLTYRIGRHAPGCASIIQDTIALLATSTEERKSLLLMGKPGTGKTTLLREIAYQLSSDELRQSVMIVDSSNEIGGDSEIPHPAVGFSRRMEVPDRAKQHQQMIEAVQNHSPNIIIIDEIGTSPEVQAAQTIAHRGVSLIATAHGNSLAAAVRNNVLKPLLGGIETVLLSAKEAENDKTGQKGKHRTVRKEPPTFSTLIEILKPGYVRIYHALHDAVDMYLQGSAILVEERWLSTTPTGQKIFGKFAFVTPGALKGDMDTVKAVGEAVAAVFAKEK